MMSEFYSAPAPAWRPVTRNHPCAHCGKPDWCSRSDDSQFEICRRHNDGTAKAGVDSSGSDYFTYYVGSYVSRSLGSKIFKYRKAPKLVSVPKASAAKLDEVYSFFLTQLGLSEAHRENLKARGLTNEAISLGGFKSFSSWRTPTEANAIFKKWPASFLQRVPGFFYKNGQGHFAGAPGILIPVRNTDGLIVGLRVRLDQPINNSKYLWISSTKKSPDGAGPGALIHVPLHHGVESDIVRVTEGELKAEIATRLSGLLTISLPGATIWGALIPTLRSLGTKTVLLALDSDANTNPHVSRQLQTMSQALRNEGFSVELETWNEKSKGIDETLLKKEKIEIHRGDDAPKVIEEIVKNSKQESQTSALDEARTLVQEVILNLGADCGLIFEDKTIAALNLIRSNDSATWARIHSQLRGKVSLHDLKRALKKQRPAFDESFEEDGADLDLTDDGQFAKGSSFEIRDNCIYQKRRHENGITPIKLSNFTARIVNEEIIDDGISLTKFFVIEGTLYNGTKLPPARVPSEKFSFMNWVIEQWGVRANVTAGFGKKDSLRQAIQEYSQRAQIKRTYGHTGWVKKDDEWVYLFSGGAISKNGLIENFEVTLFDSKLKGYELRAPESVKDLAKAIRSSLSILNIASPRISFPVFAATYCAPLGEMQPIDFSLALYGITGRGKTQMAALAQAHFGARFHGKHLPGNWSSTANALEKQAFLAKDAIFTIDDFAPQQTPNEAAKLNQTAERIFRSQGNRSGRGRLDSEMKARPEYFPRGLVLSTGEDLPKTQSIRARLLVIEFNEGDLNFDLLTPAQKAAQDGDLVKAMTGYVQWIAARVPELKVELEERHHELRRSFSSGAIHRRAPEIAASLMMAFETFLRFATEAAAINQARANELREKMLDALSSAIDAQQSFQASEDPAIRFLSLIGGALVSGRAHLADARTGMSPQDASRFGWQLESSTLAGNSSQVRETFTPLGARIGWVSETELMLDPDSAFAIAQNLARDQKNELSISEMTLWKQLAEKGFIIKGERRNTIRRTINGGRPYVLVFPNRDVFVEKGATGSTVSTSGNMSPL
jgi:DNA polymerase III delta prime subunit